MNFDTTIICPDSPAGYQALQESMGDGWEYFCQWVEPEFRSAGITHIALRRLAIEKEPMNDNIIDDIRKVHAELTTGDLVDRSHRAEVELFKIIQKWSIKDEQGHTIRAPGR